MQAGRAGASDEAFIVGTVTTLPLPDAEEPDSPVLGPFEPDSDNRSTGVSVYPAGKTTSYRSSAKDERTFRLKAMERGRVTLTKAQLFRARRTTSARVFKKQDFATIPRFGTNIRNYNDESGDTAGAYRGITEDFARWSLSGVSSDYTNLKFGSGTVICDRPALLEETYGRLVTACLIHDGTHNRIAYDYIDPDTAILTVPVLYHRAANGTIQTSSPINTITSLSANTATASFAGCRFGDELYFAVGRSPGTAFPNSNACYVHVIRGTMPDGTDATITFEHVATIDLKKQFGSNILLHQGGKPCGISMAAGSNEMVLAIGCVTRGAFSGTSSDHLTVLYARSEDGKNWGSTGTSETVSVQFASLPNIEPLNDRPNQVNHPTPKIRRTSFSSTLTGWGVGEDGTIWRTVDGGLSWDEQKSAREALATDAGPVKLYGVHAYNSSVVYACGEKATVLKTTNGGGSWGLCVTSHVGAQSNTYASGMNAGSALPTSNTFRQCVFSGTATGWVVGDGGQVWLTTDGGANWTSKRGGTVSANTVYHDVALRDSSIGLVICGSPDSRNSGHRIVATADGTASTVTWSTTDVSLNSGEALYAMTRFVGGTVHGHYGWGTAVANRGMMVGENGLMIAYDEATTPTELTDQDGNRWTSLDLYSVHALNSTTRFIGGENGNVLRTIDYPTGSVSGGTPSFSQEFIPAPQAVYAVNVSGTAAVSFAGADGFAVLNGGATNRCFPSVDYLPTGEYLIACANTSQGELEFFRSSDNGARFTLQSTRRSKASVRFASSTNSITSDNGTTGTPAPWIGHDIYDSEFCTIGNGGSIPQAGLTADNWGIVSTDEGLTWTYRRDQSLDLPFGKPTTSGGGGTPDSGVWHWNRSRVTASWGGGRLWAAVCNGGTTFTTHIAESSNQIGFFIAREWSTSSTLYPPIVVGKSIFIGSGTATGDPRCVWSGFPVVGDVWTSNPRYRFGDQNMLIESPSVYMQVSNNASSAGGTVDSVRVWDRAHPNTTAVLGEGSNWDVTAFAMFGTNFEFAYIDLSTPSYAGTVFPSSTSDYSRFSLYSTHGVYDVTAEVGAGILTLEDDGSSPGFAPNYFATGQRKYYAAFYHHGTAYGVYRIISNTANRIEIPRTSISTAFTGKICRIYSDRMCLLGGTVTLANGSVVASDLADSIYRYPRFIRLVVPSRNTAGTPPFQYENVNDARVGSIVFGVKVPFSASPTWNGFATGFGWQPVTNTIEQTGPSGVSAVEHIGRTGQRWRIVYPAMQVDERDKLLDALTKDNRMRQAFAFVVDSSDTKTAELVRLVDAPGASQDFGTHFTLPVELVEVV